MRALVLGGNLAGLLAALDLQRQGAEVSLLVHQHDATPQALPPMLFTDPGPWRARQGVWATLGGLLQSHGDFRWGQAGWAQLPWLLRSLRHHLGAPGRNQALRALAMARQSTLMYAELRAAGCVLPEAESLPQLTIFDRASAGNALHQYKPGWHLGEWQPTVTPLSEQVKLLPALNQAWARPKASLNSNGLMVSDPSAVIAALRQHLCELGVRFFHDQWVGGVEHIGEHLHSVTLCGPQGQVEQVDTDLVVATSVPASDPVLKAVNCRLDMAHVTRSSLCVRMADSSAPVYLHDPQCGTRLIRRGREVWALGPTWLGSPNQSQASEVAQRLAQISRYFGPKSTPVGDLPLMQTNWAPPDGLPVVRRTRTRNLFLNIGHDSASTSMAFGSAAQLRALINQALNISQPLPVVGHSLGQIYE